MCDDQQYFEYNCPKVYVGLKCEYQDETKVRKPNNYTTTNNNEVKVTNYMSGVLGSWNDFYGKISISRVKDSAGNHVWSVSINKLYQGNIIANKKFTKTINNAIIKIVREKDIQPSLLLYILLLIRLVTCKKYNTSLIFV